MTQAIPSSDVDVFDEEVVKDPHGPYRRLRDIGPVVRMEQYGVWAMPRYAEVLAASKDHLRFSAGSGVSLNAMFNEQMAGGSALASDPPLHTRLRRILGARLTPRALEVHRENIQRQAHALVGQLIEKRTFDVFTDFSSVFPLSVVPDLLGCPEDGRQYLLEWASAGFQSTGPMNERTKASLPALQEFLAYAVKLATEERFTPGSWGEEMLHEARAGEIAEDSLPALVIDYLGPSIDTTINALSTAIWQFGRNPRQWEAVRADPSLIPNVINESVRLEAPVRGFSRLLLSDYELGDLRIPAGERVFLMYGSANRDERHWSNPDVFDIHRNTAGHLGFGAGVHSCVGQGLAKLEGDALFTALADRVTRFEVGEPVWRVHNILRGIASMPVTLHV